jgi:hypothetical protein
MAHWYVSFSSSWLSYDAFDFWNKKKLIFWLLPSKFFTLSWSFVILTHIFCFFWRQLWLLKRCENLVLVLDCWYFESFMWCFRFFFWRGNTLVYIVLIFKSDYICRMIFFLTITIFYWQADVKNCCFERDLRLIFVNSCEICWWLHIKFFSPG